MFGLSATEIGVILLVALLVFGPTQLPKIARRLGRTLGELRHATDELKDSIAENMRDDLGTPGRSSSETKGDKAPDQRTAPAPQKTGETASGGLKGASIIPTAQPDAVPQDSSEKKRQEPEITEKEPLKNSAAASEGAGDVQGGGLEAAPSPHKTDSTPGVPGDGI